LIYEQDNTSNTCYCIKAIPSYNPDNAMINAKGKRPKNKKMIPELIVLYVNPLKIFKSM